MIEKFIDVKISIAEQKSGGVALSVARV